MSRQKTLAALAAAVAGSRVSGDGDRSISGLAYDSRNVAPGFLFLAVPGERFDGHAFIAAAIEAGAVAVMIQADRADTFADLPVPSLIVPDCRKAMAPLACALYDDPSRQLYLVGVTGTNGKTTTTLMIDSIARAAGDITGTIGTLGATVAGNAIPHDRTTPEAPDLQYLFAQMYDAGARSAAMEVSSHALVTGRVEGCAFDVGVFTNLTQDHLDFHKTMEAYRDAKGMLFVEYAEAARTAGKSFVAVLNIGNGAGQHYAQENLADHVITYAVEGKADIYPVLVEPKIDSILLLVETPVGQLELRLHFGGLFNIENALAAIGYGIARGLSPTEIRNGLARCEPVPGRFEPVRLGQDFAVLVDYAHTPDGLENVLNSARPLTEGRLIAVFGCGGNRDRTKRPIMGGIAARLADVVVVTSDNPRREEPESIIDEIFTGIPSGGAEVHRESDRRQAIALAVRMAKPGDTIVIAGKGHEDYQILGDETIHFSDVEVATEEIAARQQADNAAWMVQGQ